MIVKKHWTYNGAPFSYLRRIVSTPQIVHHILLLGIFFFSSNWLDIYFQSLGCKVSRGAWPDARLGQWIPLQASARPGYLKIQVGHLKSSSTSSESQLQIFISIIYWMWPCSIAQGSQDHLPGGRRDVHPGVCGHLAWVHALRWELAEISRN